MTLSGGMKRRVLIAKALSHEPQILFLDEPTAGVDVELRRDMWELVRALRETGVTIILTTHYIDEAEEMADRIGVINKGEIILVEDKAELMRKLGKKQLTLQLHAAARRACPTALAALRARARRRTAASSSTPTTRRASAPASPALLQRPRRRRHRLQGPADRRRARSRTSSSSLVRKRAMNLHAVRAIYRFEMARTWRTLLQSIVSPVHLDVALLRRVRRGDRLAHHRDRRRQLRRLHRAGPDHAVAADAEHLQRLVRHLLPEVHRHDLRAAVGAGLVRSRS